METLATIAYGIIVVEYSNTAPVSFHPFLSLTWHISRVLAHFSAFTLAIIVKPVYDSTNTMTRVLLTGELYHKIFMARDESAFTNSRNKKQVAAASLQRKS